MGLLHETSSRERQVFSLYVSLAVLFVVVYLLLFPLALPAEFTFVPRTATVLDVQKAERLTVGGSYFVLGDQEGYWAPSGALELVEPRKPQLSVWGDRRAWYDAAQAKVVVENAKGPLFSLAGETYPLWIKGRLFTLDENRLGLASWSPDGRLLWRKQFSSLITAVDSTEKLTAVGSLDGRLQVFGVDGKPVGGFQPGGSRLPVVYNVSLAPDDSTILLLAGVDPKRFLILERGAAEFRPVFHKPLKESRPWATPLGFFNNGALAYYQTDDGLALLDPHSPGQEVVLPAAGTPTWLESLEGGALVAFVERSDEAQSLRIASVKGTSLLTLPFSAQHLLLQRQGTTIFLGVDQTLLSLEVQIQ